MTTLSEDSILDRLRERRATLTDRRAAIVDLAKSEMRQFLSEDEERTFTELGNDLKALDSRITELEEEEARNSKANAFRRLTRPNIRVGNEASTYRPDVTEVSYFRDLVLRQLTGDSAAVERLSRYATEVASNREYRDLTRTDGSGGEFVPPLHLVNEYAEKARASRVTADRMTVRPLPGGTDNIIVPRLTGGASVAIQTADNAAVSETDPTDANTQAPVRTIAGQVDVSVQLLEQSAIAFDQVIIGDLLSDYAAKLDTQVISGSGAAGQVTGLRTQSGTLSITYTDASPTLPELLKKLADSFQQVATNRFLAPSSIVMHPRRWAWALAENDTTNRPLIESTAGSGNNTPGQVQAMTAEGRVGTLLGLPVYVDANIPTNLGGGTEDVVLVLRGEDHFLFEGTPRTRVLPEVGSGTLTTRIQLYNFVAFTAGRYPVSTAIVSGTGLIAPTFA